jgi:hypothetical protein
MKVKEGDIVVIKSAEEALINSDDEWEEHYFLVDEVFEDLVTGHSLTGALKDVYGEPDLTLIKKVYREITN